MNACVTLFVTRYPNIFPARVDDAISHVLQDHRNIVLYSDLRDNDHRDVVYVRNVYKPEDLVCLPMWLRVEFEFKHCVSSHKAMTSKVHTIYLAYRTSSDTRHIGNHREEMSSNRE